MPSAVKQNLNFALIYPFLTYGIGIWGYYSVTQLIKLDSKYNKRVKKLARNLYKDKLYQTKHHALKQCTQYFALTGCGLGAAFIRPW